MIPRRRIGSLEVSELGLGGNNFGAALDGAATARVVDAALDGGIDFIDTAEAYGDGESERLLGAALKGRRQRVSIATKWGAGVSGARGVRAALEGSLRRLGTDNVDLYQLHRFDPQVPVEETLGDLRGLVEEGKVREAGCSNFAAWQLADADWTARTRGLPSFVSAQNRYSLIDRRAEQELLPACERFGVAFIPYSPLAGGVLTGKYDRGRPPPVGTRMASHPRAAQMLSDRNLGLVSRLRELAAQRETSLLSLAIGFLLSRPQVASVIAGATSPDQVRANIAAAAWRPGPEDLQALEAISPGPTGSGWGR